MDKFLQLISLCHIKYTLKFDTKSQATKFSLVGHIFHSWWSIVGVYLTLRSVLSLNCPQNNEMKFYEKYEVEMLKIIIIIIGYTLNNFTTHIIIL